MSRGTVDRERPPAPGPIRSFDFPAVATQSLPNGLVLRTARLPRLPVVSVALVVGPGESVLEHERAGLAVLAGDAVQGGTDERSGADLAEALEGIGATLQVSTGWDATTVHLSCLAQRLEEGLALLAEVLRRPAYPEDEVERSRNQRLAAIEQRVKDPGSLADDRLVAEIYAEGEPYGRRLSGTPASVTGLGRDEVRAHARASYRPGGGGLVVVGDVDHGEIVALAGEHLGDWSGDGPARVRPRGEARSRERRIVVVHRPGAVQSEIRMGHPGRPKGSDDHFPLLVANTILGGAFTSRLNLELREKLGYTYGVRSRFAFRRGPGPFSVSTAVETEVTAQAVEAALAEVETLVRVGPAAEEVESARDYIAGVFPLRFETTGQVASRLGELVVYDLPDDYHATYRDRVRAVTPGAAAAALERNVRPGELAVLVVGDAERIREPLESLGAAPVSVVDASG